MGLLHHFYQQYILGTFSSLPVKTGWQAICRIWIRMKLYEELIKHQLHSLILHEVLFIMSIQFPFSSFGQCFSWLYCVISKMFIVSARLKFYTHCFCCFFFFWCRQNIYQSINHHLYSLVLIDILSHLHNFQLTIFYSVNNKIEVVLHILRPVQFHSLGPVS